MGVCSITSKNGDKQLANHQKHVVLYKCSEELEEKPQSYRP